MWTPRSPLRWGDSFSITVAAGPFVVLTPELVRVEAPNPCVWRLQAIAAGLLAGDGAVLNLVTQLGVGAATVAVGDTGADAIGLPAPTFGIEHAAHWVAVRLRITGVALAPRDIVAQAWIAPLAAWSGIEVEGCQ